MLTDRAIPPAAQAAIAHAGFDSLGAFRHLGRSEDDIRDNFCERELGLLAAGGRESSRSLVAKILDTWSAARKRVACQDEAEAEARALKMPRQSLKGTHVELRKKYEDAFGDLEDDEFPA